MLVIDNKNTKMNGLQLLTAIKAITELFSKILFSVHLTDISEINA